jgi:hypothetical protein
MKVPVTSALRAELSRARASIPEDRLALFVLGLTDEGDLPAWELATQLLPDNVPPPGAAPCQTLLIGAAPLPRLVHTLFRAGERELSAALRASSPGSVPVVLVQDVVRVVTALDAVEADEADLLLFEAPAGHA